MIRYEEKGFKNSKNYLSPLHKIPKGHINTSETLQAGNKFIKINCITVAIIQVYKGLPLSPHPFESWMEYWHMNSDQWVIWCAERHCKRIAMVASVVQIIDDIHEDSLYVVPFCKGHAVSDKSINTGSVKPLPIPKQQCSG